MNKYEVFEYQLRDGGVNSVVDTLLIMSKYALAGRDNLRIILLTRKLMIGVDENNQYEEARRIFDFVKNEIRYIADPLGHEMIISPDKLLQIKQGDCDDKATITAAMLLSVGIPARFVAIHRPSKKSFSHVYCEANIFGKWLPMDATTKQSKFGVAPIAIEKIIMPAETYALKSKHGVTMKYNVNQGDIEYIEIPDNVVGVVSKTNALGDFDINKALNSALNVINGIGNVMQSVSEKAGAAGTAIKGTVPKDQQALEDKLKKLQQAKDSAKQTTEWYKSPATWLTVGGIVGLSLVVLMLPKK